MGITIVAGVFTLSNTFLGVYLTQWKPKAIKVERAPTTAASAPG